MTRRLLRLAFSATLAAFAGTCSAAEQYERLAQHAVEMCHRIASPEAEKEHGEVGFWFKADRVKTSRQLWNRHGLIAINALLSRASNLSDRKCLEQLQQEARTHQVVPD